MRRPTGLPALLIASALVASGGCQAKKADNTILYQFHANGYEVECDGQLKRTVIGAEDFTINREPALIQVTKGRLIVGDREFGPVKPGDKISVVGEKVSVNGSEAKPGA